MNEVRCDILAEREAASTSRTSVKTGISRLRNVINNEMPDQRVTCADVEIRSGMTKQEA